MRGVVLLAGVLVVGGCTEPRERPPESPEGPYGFPCTADRDCASGLFCLRTAEPFCTQECLDDCFCPEGARCVSPVGETGSVCASGVNTCASRIDAGCEAGDIRSCVCPSGDEAVEECVGDGTWGPCLCYTILDAGPPRDAGGMMTCGTPCAGATSVMDADGNSYATIAICSQCWMRQNLRVGRFRGAVQGGMSDDGLVDKYCPDDVEARCAGEGGLYEWGEVMGWSRTPRARGLCPTGWHVPTDEEWMTLEMALGMTRGEANTRGLSRGTDQGDQLRVGGGSGFDALMVGGFFQASPAPYDFVDDGTGAYFWTSTSTLTAGNAWARIIRSSSSGVTRSVYPQVDAYSVRCLRD